MVEIDSEDWQSTIGSVTPVKESSQTESLVEALLAGDILNLPIQDGYGQLFQKDKVGSGFPPGGPTPIAAISQDSTFPQLCYWSDMWLQLSLSLRLCLQVQSFLFKW